LFWLNKVRCQSSLKSSGTLPRVLITSAGLKSPASIPLSTKTPWRNEAGEIIGISGVSTDMTERERRAQHMEFVMGEL